MHAAALPLLYLDDADSAQSSIIPKVCKCRHMRPGVSMLKGLCSSTIHTGTMLSKSADDMCILPMMHPAVDAKNVHTGAYD